MSEQTPKLSIITAVYNQLPMNQIYWENLVKNTHHSFELIVIDNAGDATAAVAALKKTDAVSALLPLVVIAGAAEHDACYRAGANACLSKPPALGALAEAVAAIVAFWLSVNELPNGTD